VDEAAGRLESAFLAAGRAGAERLRSTPGLDASAPLEVGRRSQYGDLVSRLIERRAAKAGLSTAAVVGAARTVRSAGLGGGTAGGANDTTADEFTPSVQGWTPTVHDPLLVLLVNRVTGGFHHQEYALAESLGFSGYLDYHLDPDSIPDPDVVEFLAGDPTITPTGDPTKGYFTNVADDNAETLVITDPNQPLWIALSQGTTIYRTLLTKRRLHDRMTEFWTDHFNIDIRLPIQGFTKPVDDREVVRAHALGLFPDMLVASAHSGAMLIYLDQWASSYLAPNENYARELLELHTLGEGNGYTEEDIEEVAQILCGWSIQTSAGSGEFLTYGYNPALHDPAAPAYTLLRNHAQKIDIPAGGEVQGDALLAGLATHPLTADYIAYKLCRFLLAYDPDPAVVSQVSTVYQSTGGDVAEMIRTILTPANLNALLGANPTTLKVKRPMQLAAGFLRRVRGAPSWPSGGEIYSPPQELIQRLDSLGNAPFFWGPPNGYPDAEGAWIGNLLGRWDLLDSLTRDELLGIRVEYLNLVHAIGSFPVNGLGARMNEVLAGGAMTSDEEFWIQEYADIGAILLNLGAVTMKELLREIYAVAASAPSYQYY